MIMALVLIAIAIVYEIPNGRRFAIEEDVLHINLKILDNTIW
jgi:hypothetical protein